MILGMSIGAFTILHVIITLVAIGSGLIVVGGMFASHRLPVTTALFLFTTALTSVTGFRFPIHGLTPALEVGILACVISFNRGRFRQDPARDPHRSPGRVPEHRPERARRFPA